MYYTIVKIVNDTLGEQILIYPDRENDQIYSFDNLLEAQQKLNNLQNNPIYSDCTLKIIETTSLF